MTDYIFKHSRPIARELLSGMQQADEGNPALQIQAYYYKDARRRGLKLSISRVLQTEWGFSYDLLNRHNGLVHLADMARKPSPKVASEWAERIKGQLDKVAEIAIASEAPDWNQVAALFAEVPA
jgi:hypothetical protein